MRVDEAVITCCNAQCGISFAVPEWWAKGRRETHATFYCQNGHSQSYQTESNAEKFRRERDIARQQMARVEQEREDQRTRVDKERIRAEKAEQAKKKLEKRTAAGTCPCCQRTFSNMTTHMRKQHPQFVAGQVTNVVPMKQAK